MSEPEAVETAAPDDLSAMTPRFNFLFRHFAKRYFSHFDLDDATVAKLQALEARGSVVYVMRYSSRLDYFLFNELFRREGLRLSRFANGLRFYYYRPLFEWLRIALLRPRGRPHELRRSEEQEHVRRLVSQGQSMFLFLRTARLRSWLRGRRAPPRQDELGAIQQLVRDAWDGEGEVHIVPLALFWRKGPRTESRFLNLTYGELTRPSDLAKVSSFLATYRDLSVKCGEAIDLRGFIGERRGEGPDRVARKVRRSILIYLYGEEKVVEGPTVRAPHRVWAEVGGDAKVRSAIDARIGEREISRERALLDAESMFREIAANMNSTFLAASGALVAWIFKRMFAGIEVSGIERVIRAAKRHPLVLVPNHRSYFDFLILSWLFYQRFLVPPHIAARDNMAFGPFGFLFRRAGAFFMRKNFDDPLYKEIFRAYVSYLVREGFTQEFFIEGGRSRTGKMLAPRFGFLSWDVEAFLDSGRRDLLFVPIAITYERLVEESAMIDELEGGEKSQESVLGLVRARRFLRSRFGAVHIRFAEPLSLADAMGDRIDRFRLAPGAESLDEQTQAEKRAFIERFGNRLVESINAAVVANATSVAAAALLGSQHRGLLRENFVQQMQWIVELLRVQGIRFTKALERDLGDFGESIAFLRTSSLVDVKEDLRGEIVFFNESRRRALDIYRNAIVHALATPSALARSLLAGATEKQIHEDLEAWRQTFYQEYFQPGGDAGLRLGDELLELFAAQGFAEQVGEKWVATASARGFLRCLEEQTRGVIEAYAAVARAVASAVFDAENPLDHKLLLKEAQVVFERAELLGEATRPEAANATTFGNAIDWLVRERVLLRQREGSSVRYAPGEDPGALDALERRLAGAIGDR